MNFLEQIKRVFRRLIPFKSIEQIESVDSSLNTEMQTALELWYLMYTNQPEWLREDTVKSLNLPALICSEMARQITLEMKWNITGKPETDSPTEDVPMNPRAQFLKDEFEKLMDSLRIHLEQGLASGGMIIKPYANTDDGHLYFTFDYDWGIYPMAFDSAGYMRDVIFRDIYTEGKYYYTRLERHKCEGKDVEISQRVFKSMVKDSIGTEIDLGDVSVWSMLEPKVIVKDVDGQMFGWYKVANANTVDPSSPIGASIYAKAVDVIHEADLQYSRLLWEYEGSELAIDVDPNILKPRKDKEGEYIVPHLNERLFRGVDLGHDETYNVFAPPIRDTSLVNGLNKILQHVEALCGLARGTLSDANVDARTATEINVLRQRTYATIADNQAALERCLRDVVRVMDKYATLYKLAPEGEYEVSFEWDDSIVNDMSVQMQERMALFNMGILGKAEFREWYFGETPAQAEAAINAIQANMIKEQAMAASAAMMPGLAMQDAPGVVQQMKPRGDVPPTRPTEPLE